MIAPPRSLVIATSALLLAALVTVGCKSASPADPLADVNSVEHDKGVWHGLLEDHTKLRRTVTHLDNGIEATTESDDPAVAARIKEHALAMKARMSAGARVRVWDPVFNDLFDRHSDVQLAVTVTDKGVTIVETTSNPETLAVLRSHAMGVSDFVREGFDASARATPRFSPADPIPAPELAIGGVPHRFVLGQPSAAQLAAFKRSGVAGVVSFRKPAEQPDFNEESAATGEGLVFTCLPYAGAAELTDETFAAGRAALKAAANQSHTLALHCRTGNRVGPVWAAYRVLDQGVPVEQAIAEAKALRMRDPALEARAREYVAAHAKPGIPAAN
ncbi:MAG: hypothetical protein ACOYN0_16025 [Phycisphaerales bacterium]